MPSQKNIDQLKQLTETLKGARAVYLVDYQGLGVNDMNVLREQLRQAGGQLIVVKNTLFAKGMLAADEEAEIGLNELKSKLSGGTAALLALEDQIEPLKVLVKYAREHELPTIKLGVLDHRMLNAEQVEALSKLPGLLQMRAQTVGMLASPLSRLVGSLNSSLSKLAIVLNEIRMSKAH